MIQVLSIFAVAGAWVAGLGVIATVMCFCFGILSPRLFKWGLNYLLVTDLGFIVMFGALLGILNDTTLWAFTLVGLLLLVGFTVAAFIIIRNIRNVQANAVTVYEGTRRRIEF